jgi:3-oxoacyl-[acyl-carrier-protein] synthase III
MNRALIHSVQYTLGERRRSYLEAPGFGETIRLNAMPRLPELFAWGDYYSTELPIVDIAIDAAAKTLASSGVRPNDIDLVLICSVNFHAAGSKICQTILSKLGLSRAFPVGLTLNDCTMLLSTLELARSLIVGGQNHVLVVSVNKVEDERHRFLSYALFSDGAVACMVSRNAPKGYEILGSELLSGVRSTGESDISDDGPLYLEAQRRFTNKLKLSVADLDQVFCNNLFAPIVKIKEGRLGVRLDQLFLDNISRTAHCFSADTLINLVDYSSSGHLRNGSLVMLTSDAEGLRAQIGLRFHA